MEAPPAPVVPLPVNVIVPGVPVEGPVPVFEAELRDLDRTSATGFP